MTTSASLAAIFVGTRSAQAEAFLASYAGFYGQPLTFDLDGVLQPDKNTIFINSITNAKWGGVSGGLTDVVLSYDEVLALSPGPYPPATTSIDGSIQNFFTYPSGGQGGFWFRTASALGDIKGGSPIGGYGDYGPTVYSKSNWSLRSLQNTPGPLPVFGAAAAFLYSRRIRKRIRERGSSLGPDPS